MKHTRHKQLIALFISTLMLTSLVFLGACKTTSKPDDSVKPIIITADFSRYDLENKNLNDLMAILQHEGKLFYQSSNGMITSINGTKNTTNSYWMLYTDDQEHSNQAWGTLEYNGKTYFSATLGFEELPLRKDCTYIWSYQNF